MLRSLSKSDLDQLLLIESAVQVAPWTEETFKMCFQYGYLGWVIEADKKITGFIILSIRSEECHILNLCVAREFQHQGVGRSLLNHVLQHAKKQAISIVYLEVRRSNTRAIALYQKMHFHLIGERKDYYPLAADREREDALIFAKSLQEPLF